MTYTIDKNNNETKTDIINNLSDDFGGPGATAIVINNELHVMGAEGNRHMKYDINTKSAQWLHNFATLNVYGPRGHRIVRIKDKILMFGGREPGFNIDGVHEYDINDNKWRTLQCKLPIPIDAFGCTSILNGKFVILCGGSTDDRYNEAKMDDIYIYSVFDQTFMKSKIKCPTEGDYQAFSIHDERKDVFATFGFIRSSWRQCGIRDDLFPPEYLVRIICHYYWNEWIHLFRIGYSDHYAINVFKLFD